MDNTPEAVEVWAAGLQQRFGGRYIAVCLEQSRGGLVYMLAKYPHLVLFPVHPTTAAKYRETFVPSGAKSDPSDTASLLDLLLRHRDTLRRLQPDTEATRLLQFLVEGRRHAVDEKTRQSNRLGDCLKRYFPQVPRWFDDVSSLLVGALLERWPSLPQLQRVHPGTLRQFFQRQNCRSAELIQQRIAAIREAVPATEDKAVVEGCSMIALGLVAQIAVLRKNIADIDKRIHEVISSHPDGALFASLPGAGEVLVPRLVVAFGTDRNRWESAYEMQCFSGIAPVTVSSGKTEWVHLRWACPKFQRQTFHEWAGHSIQYSEWAKAYYQHQRQVEKKDHHAAVRALGFKWIRIAFRCWKDRTPYDEATYLESLRRRRSLLGPALAGATNPGWTTVAGFQKLSEKKA